LRDFSTPLLWSISRVANQSVFRTVDRSGPEAAVTRTGAAFVVSGCQTRGRDLRPPLGPLVADTRRFGCAVVYEVRPR
jgi:hypothetical protein